MVKSGNGGGGSIPPFLKKCYEMVDDESTNTIISWGEKNDSFIIRDMTEFSVHLLPSYFKHNNFSSFIRQLNIYGFRKIDTDRWEFANDGFIRGQNHLLKNIQRRKHSQGADNNKSVQQHDNCNAPSENIENEELLKEVETLKTDKNALMQELVKLRQHQEMSVNKLLLLRDQLQGMEKNQQQMLSFLVMVMQSPGFLVQLLHPKEHNWRMAEPGSIIEQGADDTESLVSNGMIVRYRLPMDGMTNPETAPPSALKNLQQSDSSSDGAKDFFVNPEFMKVLMDENLHSFDNHAPFVLPELVNDSSWEQLLASPVLENVKDAQQDGEQPDDADFRMETTMSGIQLGASPDFELLIKEMEKTQCLENEAGNHVTNSEV